MKHLLCALFLFACLSCKKQNQDEQSFLPEEESTEVIQEPILPKEVSLQNFTYEDIARYTMSAVMFQPAKIIKVKKKDDLYLVSYVRKSDSQKFDYKVKFEGNKIIWANSDGRWRDLEVDEKISFAEEGNKIKIIQTFSDGSESVEEYAKGQ